MAKKPEPFNPAFAALKLKQEAKAPVPEKTPVKAAPPRRAAPSRPQDDDDARLFLEAVGEVATVQRGPDIVRPPPSAARSVNREHDDAESLARLAELVAPDQAFDISADAVEGMVKGLDPRVVRKLKAGAFEVQAELDLHGLRRGEALAKLEAFVSKAKVAGQRCVLVLPGKGLHSEGQVGVLKAELAGWLTKGRLARHVLAFCPARPQDGGDGACYLLLRR